jgi:hypothetical protein
MNRDVARSIVIRNINNVASYNTSIKCSDYCFLKVTCHDHHRQSPWFNTTREKFWPFCELSSGNYFDFFQCSLTDCNRFPSFSFSSERILVKMSCLCVRDIFSVNSTMTFIVETTWYLNFIAVTKLYIPSRNFIFWYPLYGLWMHWNIKLMG